MEFIRRAAVLFKSPLGRGIFTTEKGVLNLPGGKIEPSESIEETAMREVREELGCWPEIVPTFSDSSMFVDCGTTRYFIAEVSEDDFLATFTIFRDAFAGRSLKERCKITDVQVENIPRLCSHNKIHVRREVEELLTMIKDVLHPPLVSGIVLSVSSGSASDALTTQAVESPASQSVVHGHDNSGSALVPAQSVSLPASVDAYTCDLCNIAGQWFNKCKECDRWTCKVDTFWCTKCPKGRDKYMICRVCNDTGKFLRRSSKIWTCLVCQTSQQ